MPMLMRSCRRRSRNIRWDVVTAGGCWVYLVLKNEVGQQKTLIVESDNWPSLCCVCVRGGIFP